MRFDSGQRIDPFHEIDPLLQNGLPKAQLVEVVCDLTIEERQPGHSPNDEDDGDEDEDVWERSAFDAFKEEEEEEEKLILLQITLIFLVCICLYLEGI